jgi:hypothetical protein
MLNPAIDVVCENMINLYLKLAIHVGSLDVESMFGTYVVHLIRLSYRTERMHHRDSERFNAFAWLTSAFKGLYLVKTYHRNVLRLLRKDANHWDSQYI